MMPDAAIWPVSAAIDAKDRLTIGGVALTDLAARFGTPVLILDEATIRANAEAYTQALALHYPAASSVHYASKAFLNRGLARRLRDLELGLDVVSGGELITALAGGVPPNRIHLHGNAKPAGELQMAVTAGIGAIVIDTLDEIADLAAIAAGQDLTQDVLLRIAPDIAVATHAHIATGSRQAKFGLLLDQLERAAAMLREAPRLRLRGLHCHLGSQILDPTPYAAAMNVMMAAMRELRVKHGFAPDTLSPGGGLGIPYVAGDPVTSIDNFVSIIAKAVVAAARQHEMPLPRLMLEPGRSIIGRAGVTLYSVLATKQLPADDTAGRYLHVDGGMGDNIRPALYGAHYTLAWPARMSAPRTEHVHIAGRYCESGDVLLRDVPAPADAAAGTVVAIAATGAYTLSMASTYNMVPRPPVVFVSQGRALLAQRRETYADLLKRDLNEPEDGAAAVA